MNITIKTDTLTPSLKKMLAKMKNPVPALRGAGLAVVSMAQDAFTAPSLRPSTWKANAASTIAQKGASSPLVASGTMARSPSLSVEVAVADGLFSVMLGDSTLPNMAAMLPEILEMRNDAHLRIWFSEDGIAFTQLDPDQPVGSTLYAMMAARVPSGAIGNAQLANNAVTGTKIANLSVAGAQIANSTITSNKIDWSTMPAIPVLRGYAENGAFAAVPVASGNNAIALGYGAVASGIYATVGGGSDNTAGGIAATVAGGESNLASNNYATVSGGRANRAESTHSTVAGGYNSRALGPYSAIGGGSGNWATGNCSIVSGGSGNYAYGEYSAVAGGSGNSALGIYSMIPGGYQCSASGPGSFAAGGRAKANQSGSFVWGDMTAADISSTTNNSVTFRAAGGYRLFSNAGATMGAALMPNATAWSALSDRNAKENFAPIDAAEILEKLAALPLTAWNYKDDPEKRRYIGPVAQDFHAAFGLGDDTSINTLDADGVALAAIQGLNQKLEEEIDRLTEENAELIERLERLEALIAGME